MSNFTIFRGLPGAGKSTRARELAAKTGAILIEPDALLIENGVYRYTPERFAEAVWRCDCLIETITSMDLIDGPGGICSDIMCPDVVYADVLPRREDVRRLTLLIDAVYDIEVIDCLITREESERHNIHNVRQEDLDRMSAAWEDWK